MFQILANFNLNRTKNFQLGFEISEKLISFTNLGFQIKRIWDDSQVKNNSEFPMWIYLRRLAGTFPSYPISLSHFAISS